MPRRLAALLVLLLLAACASATNLRPGPEGPPPGGLTMLYPQKPEAVLEAAIRGLPHIGLHVVEIDPAGRYLLAEHRVALSLNGAPTRASPWNRLRVRWA